MRVENDKKQLQVALNGSTLSELEEIIDKINSLKEEMLKINQDKLDSKSSLKKAVRALGNDSLVITFKDKPHAKFNRPPKYQYVDENGVTRTWWGGGKMPTALRKAITNDDGIEDKSLLDNYLIIHLKKYRYKDMEGNVCFWDGKGEVPKDLQILLNNGFDLSDFSIEKPQATTTKPLLIHANGSVYQFTNKKGDKVIWNPEKEDMPLDLLEKISVLGQPRPELLKKYLLVRK